jgi:phosphoribosylaminoimidazole carboxylase PurE protein
MAESVKPQIAILMGSDSDWPAMKKAYDLLQDFKIPCEVRISSAHRTPEATIDFTTEAEGRGIKVIIAAAGMAAHLAGVIAAHTTLPVIGVPMASGSLQGVDALLSTVQMPPGIPVATVGIGSAGARNAALLAIQILALSDPELGKVFALYKQKMADAVKAKNQKLQDELNLA